MFCGKVEGGTGHLASVGEITADYRFIIITSLCFIHLVYSFLLVKNECDIYLDSSLSFSGLKYCTV